MRASIGRIPRRITEDEVHRALRTLERLGASRATEIVYVIRKRIRTLDFLSSKEGEFVSQHLQLNQDISRLLLQEAGLTTAEAGMRLYQSMRNGVGKRTSVPPFRAKQGFRAWLTQLLQSIPPSEVLHHATKVRNDVVHRGAKSDWPLRDRET